jgi:hypothetical protein
VWLLSTPALSPKATFSAPFGTDKSVSNALKEVSSTLTDFVFQSALSATLSTELQETVWLVSEDTTLLMDSVSFHLPILLSLLTSAVLLGTGLTKSVSPALSDGPSTLKTFVCLFLTNAVLTLKTEIALLATKAMTSLTVNACSLFPTM